MNVRRPIFAIFLQPVAGLTCASSSREGRGDLDAGDHAARSAQLMRPVAIVMALAAAAVATAAHAQHAIPSSISGDPSSATHCVSGNAANIHPIGWVGAGVAYSVVFETGIPLHTAVARFSLSDRLTSTSYGSPDLSRTSATAGTMALFVSGGGNAGCYRFKATVASAALSTAPAEVLRDALPSGVAPSSRPLAISGAASSATHCISGSAVANVHDLGRVEQGQRVALTFASNFDAIAGLQIVNLPTQQSTGYSDDNSGGGVEPSLTVTAPHAGAMALHVAGVSESNGCYKFKVEIR